MGKNRGTHAMKGYREAATGHVLHDFKLKNPRADRFIFMNESFRSVRVEAHTRARSYAAHIQLSCVFGLYTKSQGNLRCLKALSLMFDKIARIWEREIENVIAFFWLIISAISA